MAKPWSDALAAIAHNNVPLVSLMHTEVENIDTCLDVLQSHWPGRVGVYAHTGTSKGDNWVFDDTISPHDYATAAQGWLARGVQIIGGCCGIRTEHISVLRSVV